MTQHSFGSGLPSRSGQQSGTALIVSANPDLQQQLASELRAMRWTVRHAESGASAWLRQETEPSAAVILDDWLPDLAAREFAQHFLEAFPAVDMLSVGGAPFAKSLRSARRNELLLALRAVEDQAATTVRHVEQPGPVHTHAGPALVTRSEQSGDGSALADASPVCLLPDIVGSCAPMRELAHLVHMAAPHPVSVLIEGETGTGKELVAQAVHRLSTRAARPFVTLNCAAIPEQLLEAELFGHTRGAFTGAVTSRTGRIEAAHGGTLFLDEIGEMPIGLQAKMLRFLECGEIQRIGENETIRVDVRIVAATHQPLESDAEQGRFRLDLYHRLAVFPVWVPSLRERMADLPMLVQAILQRLGETMPKRRITRSAFELLCAHTWPGNVRELVHVLQRAAILSTHAEEIRPEHIMLRRRSRTTS